MKTRTNAKIRNLNQTGVGDEIILKNTLTRSQEIFAEASNPGKKYNCRVSVVIFCVFNKRFLMELGLYFISFQGKF